MEGLRSPASFRFSIAASPREKLHPPSAWITQEPPYDGMEYKKSISEWRNTGKTIQFARLTLRPRSTFRESPSMRWTPILWSLLLVVVVTGPASPSPHAYWPATADPPSSLAAELPALYPDGRVVPARDLTLRRDVLSLRFDEGLFHLLAPVDGLGGHSPGAVFLGSGSLVLQPSTSGEARQLALRMDVGVEVLEAATAASASVSFPFERALLLYSDGTEREIVGELDGLTGAARADGAVTDQRALSVLGEVGGVEGLVGLDAVRLRLLCSRVNEEEPPGGAFYAFLFGGRFPSLVAAVDSAGILDGEETALIVEHPRDGGVWYSSHLRAELASGERHRTPALVDAEHYAIETRISRKTAIEGTATVRFQVTAPKLQVLPFELLSSLEVRDVALLELAGAESSGSGPSASGLSPPAGVELLAGRRARSTSAFAPRPSQLRRPTRR